MLHHSWPQSESPTQQGQWVGSAHLKITEVKFSSRKKFRSQLHLNQYFYNSELLTAGQCEVSLR